MKPGAPGWLLGDKMQSMATQSYTAKLRADELAKRDKRRKSQWQSNRKKVGIKGGRKKY
jgi:hypothetical protein